MPEGEARRGNAGRGGEFEVVKGLAARELLRFISASDVDVGSRTRAVTSSGNVSWAGEGRIVRGQEAKELLPRRDDRNWWDAVRSRHWVTRKRERVK